MGKKSKKKNTIFSMKSSVNEHNRQQGIKINANTAFHFSLEDSDTIFDTTKVSPTLLHNILYIMTNQTGDFSNFVYKNNIEKLYNYGIFNSPKITSLISKGSIMDVQMEIAKIAERKLPNLINEYLCDWMDVIFCLQYYFCKEEKDLDKLQPYLSYDFLLFVFAVVLEKENAREGSKLEDKTNIVKIFTNWVKGHKDYELKEISLSNPICLDIDKTELVTIFNNLYSYWVSSDSEKFKKRNDLDIFLPFEDEDKVEKWSHLVKLSTKQLIKPNSVLDKLKELKDILEEEKNSHFSSVFSECYTAALYFTYYLQNMVIADVFSFYMVKFYKENQKITETNNAMHIEEIKTLKNTNRSLTRDLKSIETELNSTKKELESLKNEYSEVIKQEREAVELDKLHKKVQNLTDELDLKSEELKKIVNKSEWKDTRISELEHNISYYDSIEADLLTLQNENNSIMEQVSRLEQLESNSPELDDFDDKLEVIKEKSILFVGGVGNMMSKFKEMFPNSDYIDISDEGVNFTVPPRFEYVVIYTRVVTHSHCRRVESFVNKDKIIPINIFNTKLVVDELYKNIVGHKK